MEASGAGAGPPLFLYLPTSSVDIRVYAIRDAAEPSYGPQQHDEHTFVIRNTTDAPRFDVQKIVDTFVTQLLHHTFDIIGQSLFCNTTGSCITKCTPLCKATDISHFEMKLIYHTL